MLPQQLYTYYSNGGNDKHQETPSTDGNTYYSMFPLAYRDAASNIYQNFCVEDYLTSNVERVATYIGSSQSFPWLLRSGYTEVFQISNVNCNGGLMCSNTFRTYGVRPAMVMKLA